MDMTAPIGTTPLDTNPDGLVGKPIDRVDGPPKVTGTATYAYEYREPEGILYGYLVPSTIAKGRIVTIDTAAAERMPGVVFDPHLSQRAETGDQEPAGQPRAGGRPDRSLWAGGSRVVVATEFEQARAAAAGRHGGLCTRGDRGRARYGEETQPSRRKRVEISPILRPATRRRLSRSRPCGSTSPTRRPSRPTP